MKKQKLSLSEWILVHETASVGAVSAGSIAATPISTTEKKGNRKKRKLMTGQIVLTR
jgi:hypothetical protein